MKGIDFLDVRFRKSYHSVQHRAQRQLRAGCAVAPRPVNPTLQSPLTARCRRWRDVQRKSGGSPLRRSPSVNPYRRDRYITAGKQTDAFAASKQCPVRWQPFACQRAPTTNAASSQVMSELSSVLSLLGRTPLIAWQTRYACTVVLVNAIS